MYVHLPILLLSFRESNKLVITPTRGYNFNNDDEAIMTDIEQVFTNHEYRIIKKG
jgi:site-specific DNA recombinase